MPAKTKLSRRAERKQALIRTSDSFREDCGRIWAVADRRVLRLEQRAARRVFMHPAVPELLGTGLVLLQARLQPKNRAFQLFVTIANALLAAVRNSMAAPDEPAPNPVRREREEAAAGPVPQGFA